MVHENKIERMRESAMDKIIMYRIVHDMSQQEMADMLEITQCTYSRYETHDRLPTLDFILAFCIETEQSLEHVLNDRDRELKEYVANLPRDKRKAIDKLKMEMMTRQL